jgi:hypothetical protein
MTDDRPDSGKRTRRWKYRLASLVGAVLLFGVIGYAALPNLAERFAEDWLAAHQIPGSSVKIQNIGFNRATIGPIRLGRLSDAPRIDLIEIAYTLSGLGFPEIDRIDIDGLTITVDPHDSARPLGVLSDLIATLPISSEEESLAFPEYSVRNATVQVPTVLDGIDIAIEGWSTEGQTTRGAMFEIVATSTDTRIVGTISLDGDPAASLHAAMTIESADFSDPQSGLRIAGVVGQAEARLFKLDLTDFEAHAVIPEVFAPGWPTAGLTFDGAMRGSGAVVTLKTDGVIAGLEGTIRAEFDSLAVAEPEVLSFEGELAANAPWWALMGLPTPMAGSTSIAGSGRIEADLATIGESRTLPPLEGEFVVQATGLDFPGRLTGLDMSGAFDFAFSGNAWSAIATTPLLITASIEPDVFAVTGLQDVPIIQPGERIAIEFGELRVEQNSAGDDTVRATGSAVAEAADGASMAISGAITLAPDGHLVSFNAGSLMLETGPFDWRKSDLAMSVDRLTISGSATGSAADCAASILVAGDIGGFSLSGVEGRSAIVNLPMDLFCDETEFRLQASEPGMIKLTGLRSAEMPYGIRNGSIAVAAGAQFATPRGCTESPCNGRLSLAGTTSNLVINSPETNEFMTLAPVNIQFDGLIEADRRIGGRIHVGSPLAEFAAMGTTVRDIDVQIDIAASRLSTFSVDAAQIENVATAGWLPAFASTIDGKIRGGIANFEARAADADNRIVITATGVHDFSNGTGTATIDMQPIQFRPGGLQPWDIAPALAADIDEATGQVSLGGNVIWNNGVLKSEMSLRLTELSLIMPEAEFARVNGIIELQSLSPLISKPNQTVSAALIDVGVPLTDALITFAIEPGPRIAISEARLTLAEGSVETAPVSVDPFGTDTHIDLTVTNMDLSQFLAMAEVEGLAGTGLLSGTIPVDVRNNDVVISGGRLDATGPGTLRYAPGEAPAGLRGAGETASLVLAALADFRYEKLWLTLDRASGGETDLGLHVRGSNPDFFDGYPIEFNLSLTGELDRILRDSLVGYRIPDIVKDRLEAGPDDSAGDSP